jgi:serine phosphatase RsbU (regulator of sigma subunit)
VPLIDTMIRKTLILIFFSLPLLSHSANLDSLKSEWLNKSNSDSVRTNSLINLVIYYQSVSPDSALKFAKQQLVFAKQTNNKELEGLAHFSMGYAYLSLDQLQESIINYKKAIELFIQVKDTTELANCHNNMALAHLRMGDYSASYTTYTKAIEYYNSLSDTFEVAKVYNQLALIRDYEGKWLESLDLYFISLDLFEKLNHDYGKSVIYLNIAGIYDHMKDDENAKKFYNQSLVLKKKINDDYGEALIYCELADRESMIGVYDSAITKFMVALKIFEKYNEKMDIAGALSGMGTVYRRMGEHNKSIDFYKKAITIQREIELYPGLSKALCGLGGSYNSLGQFNMGKKACEEGLALARKTGYKTSEKDNCYCLSTSYEGMGQHKKALDFYKTYIEIRDSLINDERTVEAARKDMQFTFAQQQFQDSVKNAQEQAIKDMEISEQKAQLQKERTFKYSLFAGILLSLCLVVIAYRSYRIKKRDNRLIALQKEEVEIQKSIVEEKNKEITDSITYAKRIQNAILPPKKLVKEWLPNSFIFYQPKDIVAGDFYWMETSDDFLFFAVADCTGHGVPGAMVSVVCHNALNRAVKEFNIKDPGKILDKTKELVIEQFENDEEEVKDGMDIALCRLNLNTNEVSYAGANNPFWILRKDSESIEEIKATKQSIGKAYSSVNYETHSIQLNKGDSMYLFSDGFADQFGGEKGKKFKYKPFKNLLIKLATLNIEEQKDKLEKAFNDWKGEHEQIDDICVIGVRV